MNQSRMILLNAALLLAAANGLASAAAPETASRPATTAATEPAAGGAVARMVPNFSTPADAARTYLQALFTNDSGTIHDALLIPDDRKADAEALLALTAAQHRLQIAAADRYRSAGEKAFSVPNAASLAAQMKLIDAGTLESQGQSATLTISSPPGAEPDKKMPGTLSFKKDGAAWKIDAVAFFQLDAPKTASRVALARDLTAITDQTVKDLIDGKFISAIDAYQQYQGRLIDASKKYAPASQPASAPATTNGEK